MACICSETLERSTFGAWAFHALEIPLILCSTEIGLTSHLSEWKNEARNLHDDLLTTSGIPTMWRPRAHDLPATKLMEALSTLR